MTNEPNYSLEEDCILLQAMMGDRREFVYRKWYRAEKIYNQLQEERGIQRPRTARELQDRFMTNLSERSSCGNSPQNRFMIETLPWSWEELEDLRDILPCFMPGGRSEDGIYVIERDGSAVVDWEKVKQAMEECNPWGLKYDIQYLQAIYRVRLDPESVPLYRPVNLPEIPSPAPQPHMVEIKIERLLELYALGKKHWSRAELANRMEDQISIPAELLMRIRPRLMKPCPCCCKMDLDDGSEDDSEDDSEDEAAF